jgi:GT2 family glycosyltransferase
MIKKICVVVPVCGRRDLVEQLLVSLQRCTLELEIAVWDNAADPATYKFEWLQQLASPHPLVLKRPPQVGTIYDAWNWGLHRDADAYFVVNDDVVVGPGALRQLVAAVEKFQLWCVYPAHTVGEFPADFVARAEAAAKRETFVHGPPEFRGFAFLLTRECVARVGFFDQRFGFYYGDDDYWYRLIAVRHPAREVGSALVHHYGQAGTHFLGQENPNHHQEFGTMVAADGVEFKAKWGGISGQELLRRTGQV